MSVGRMLMFSFHLTKTDCNLYSLSKKSVVKLQFNVQIEQHLHEHFIEVANNIGTGN